MVRYELTEGTSSKFWEISRAGSVVHTRYGRIGSAGQATEKDEGSDAAAQKLYDKLIREKTGKGYALASGAAPVPASVPVPAPVPAPVAVPPPVPVAAPAPAAAGTRRFEFVEDGSSKFWEVTVTGASHTVRYGRKGTAGQEKTKTFPSEAAAKADAEKLVGEKTRKGYAPVIADDAGAATGVDAAELDAKVAEILASADPGPLAQVLGDWLEGQGHPWGRLIALDHAASTAPTAARRTEIAREVTQLLQSQGVPILGDLARAGRPTRFEFEGGFIDEAVIASPGDRPVLPERLRTLFGLPIARRLRKLTLHCQPGRLPSHQDWDASMDDVIAPWDGVYDELRSAPPTLRELAFGEPPPTSAAAYVAQPDLAAVAARLPRLHALEITCLGGQQGLGAFGFPELRSLEIRLANANAADLTSIRAAALPALERLVVWFGAEAACTLDDVYEARDWDEDNEDANRYPEFYPSSDLEKLEIYDTQQAYTAADLLAFLHGSWPATLKHLGLASMVMPPEALADALAAPVVAQLKTLDLSGGMFSDNVVDALVRSAPHIRHLESIDLSGNRLSKAAIDRLKKELPNARPGKQREGADGPAFLFRTVATME